MKIALAPNFWKKFWIMTVAILFMGLALSFLIRVNWGYDPASFALTSVSRYTGVMFGTLSICVYGVLLVVIFVLDRSVIGAGTIINMTLVGYSSDFFRWVEGHFIDATFFDPPNPIAIKIGVFVLSLAVFIVGVAIYMKCSLGLAPYDAIPVIIHKKVFSKFPFAPVRMVWDVSVASVGVAFCFRAHPELLQSLPGAIIMCLTVGPIITLVANFMEKHFPLFKSQ